MIDFFAGLQITVILEFIIVAMICGYAVFSFLVIRQISVLVNDVKTSLSNIIYLVGIFNLLLSILAVIASVALVF